MTQQRPKHPYLIVTIILLVSVLVRLPNIDRPMSKHHEFCTAVALRVLNVWHTQSIAHFKGLPATNMPGAANKHINNFASASGTMHDTEGNYYYVSHPPLGYYMAWGFFKLIDRGPTVQGIQIFNILLHLLCVIFIYATALRLWVGQHQWALQATAIYALVPATLWFQSNTYMSDMAVQLYFVAAIYAFVRVVQNYKSVYWQLLVGLLVGLATYTSWLGVFVAFVLVVRAIWSIDRFKPMLASVVLFQCFFLLLIVYQYSSIAGGEAYLTEVLHRYAQRGLGGWAVPFKSFWKVLFNYGANFGFVLILAGLGIYVWFRQRTADPIWTDLLIVSVLPVVMLHLVLPDYSGHDFTVLYGAPALALLAGLGVGYRATNRRRAVRLTWAIGIVSVGQYFLINLPGPTSIKGDRYDVYQHAGEEIKALQKPDAPVFVKGLKPSPEILWYAHRNMLQVADETEATSWMIAHGFDTGLLVSLSGNESDSLMVQGNWLYLDR